jgi:hypothetical protein
MKDFQPTRKPPVHKREHLSLQNIIIFYFFCGSWPYLPSWTRLRIQISILHPIRLRIRRTEINVESFYLDRIVALAEPPQTGTGKGQWLSPEILSMFLFHHMRSLSHQVLIFIISSSVADPDSSSLDPDPDPGL